MATKKELEERIEQLDRVISEVKNDIFKMKQEVGKISNQQQYWIREQEEKMFNSAKQSEPDLEHIKSKIGLTPEPECIEIQRGEANKKHKVYLNAGDAIVIDGHEICFKRTDEGQLVCDHTAYNPTNEFTVREEPDHLQVGDQWRDSEGNEYVLTVLCDGVIRYFALVNKSWGGTLGYVKDGHGMTYLANNEIVRHRLGITDNMVKIK